MMKPAVFRGGRSSASARAAPDQGRPGLRATAVATGRVAAVVALVCGLALAASTAARANELNPEEVEVTTPVYHIKESAFKAGERWKIEFEWAGIPVGGFTIELRDGNREGEERLNIVVTGRSNSVIDLIYRYRLKASGSIRTKPFGPAEFRAEEYENRKLKLTNVEFDENREVHYFRQRGDSVKEARFAAPNTYDLLSGIFLMMSLDHRVGDEYYFDILTGSSRYLVTMDVEAREEIEVAGGKMEAYRLLLDSMELTDPNDKDPKHKESLFWVSAEKPKRLLRATSKTFVGSMAGRLTAIEPIVEANPEGQADEPTGAQSPAPEPDRLSASQEANRR